MRFWSFVVFLAICLISSVKPDNATVATTTANPDPCAALGNNFIKADQALEATLCPSGKAEDGAQVEQGACCIDTTAICGSDKFIDIQTACDSDATCASKNNDNADTKCVDPKKVCCETQGGAAAQPSASGSGSGSGSASGGGTAGDRCPNGQVSTETCIVEDFTTSKGKRTWATAGKYCHRVNTNEASSSGIKCDPTDEHKCPGPMVPVPIRGRLDVLEASKCPAEFTFAVAAGQKFICCPILVPKSLGGPQSSYGQALGKTNVQIKKNPKECKTNEDCATGVCDFAEFPTTVADFGPALKPAKTYCFDKDSVETEIKCAGKIGIPSNSSADIGFKLCTTGKDCGDGQFCNKAPTFGNAIAVCCSGACPQATESEVNPSATPSNTLATYNNGKNCQPQTAECKSDSHFLGKCTAADQASPTGDHFCCIYNRTVVSNSICDASIGFAPARRENSLADVECTRTQECTLVSWNAFCHVPEGSAKGHCCVAAGGEKGACSFDKFTPILNQPSCQSQSDCTAWGEGSRCEATVTSNVTKHCCPSDGKYALLNLKCKTSHDCGGYGRFCDIYTDGEPMCASGALDGTNEMCQDGLCNFSEAGKKMKAVCVINQGEEKCFQHPKFPIGTPAPKYANSTYSTVAIVCGVLGLICSLVAIVSFLKYRSRHLCDKKKDNKKKDKKEKDKGNETAVTSTGGDTTGA